MLPNLKFLICGILFCILLFAVAGTGFMLPDARTHIGEMPVIGRPMMQQSMADVSPQAQVYMTTVARRSDELERLREAAPAETAPAQPEDLPNPDPPQPDLSQRDFPTPDVVAIAASDNVKIVNKIVNPTPNPLPHRSPAEDATAVQTPLAPPAETRRDDRNDEAGPPQQVATLAPAAAQESEPVSPFVNVPLPTPRPTILNSLRRQGRVFHHPRLFAQQHSTATQGVAPSQATPLTRGGYAPPQAATR